MPGKKILKKSLRIIGIVLFVYVLSKIHWSEFFNILRDINVFYFFLNIILIIPSLSLRALRWRVLVHSTGIELPKKASIIIFAKGFFWGVVTPGKLGELSRAKYLKERGDISFNKAIFTVVFDKMAEFFFITLLCVPAILALFYLFDINFILIAAILILIIALSIYFLINTRHSRKLLKFIFKLFFFNSLREKTKAFFDEFFEQTERLNKTIITKLFFYEVIGYILMILVFFLMALSLGLTIPIWYVAVVVPLVTVAMALPISVMGLGVKEVAFIFLFSLINLNLNQAVAFSLSFLRGSSCQTIIHLFT